jgi:hypothetical protein
MDNLQGASSSNAVTNFSTCIVKHKSTLREGHRLRVFENMVLRRIFGSKRDEVTGGWRNLHDEELHNLYSLQSMVRMIKSRRLRWAGHVAQMGAKMNAYRILVGKPEGRRLLGRPRCRWVYNVKMDLRETGWDGIDWIHLAQDRGRCRALVNTVMNLGVPQNSWNFLSSCTIGSFSRRRAQLHE